MRKDAAEMVRAYNYTEDQGGDYEFKEYIDDINSYTYNVKLILK